MILAEKIFFKLFEKKGLENYLKSIEFSSGGGSASGGKDGRVLDVGCGYGWYSELFPKNYTGIDIDEEKINNARKQHPNVRFEIMSAANLAFSEESFDLSFSIAVLHHLKDEEVIGAFKKMLQATREGGRVLIIDMVLPKKLQWLAKLGFLADKGACQRSFEELLELLMKAGIQPRFKSLSRFLHLGIGVFEFLV